MKNIMIVDGADNCSYEIYAATETQFLRIFPGVDQEIEFIEDIYRRENADFEADLDFISALWMNPVKKTEVIGIHGTLFYQLEWKRKFFPSKKWDLTPTELQSVLASIGNAADNVDDA